MKLCNEINEKYDTTSFYVFIDPSARGLQEEIKRKVKTTDLNYSVHVRNAQNDVELGISRVQKLLSYGILQISPEQPKADEEFGLYEYDKKSIEKGKEVPVKVNDHCMDAIRYVVMGVWKYLKHWLPEDLEEVTEE